MNWITLEPVTTEMEAAIFGSLYNFCLYHMPHTRGRGTSEDFLHWWKELDSEFQTAYVVREHTCFGCTCTPVGIAYVDKSSSVTADIQCWVKSQFLVELRDVFVHLIKMYPDVTLHTNLWNKDKVEIDSLVALGFTAEVEELKTQLTYAP